MSKFIIQVPENSSYEPDPRGMGVLFLEKLRIHKDKIAQIDGITGETQTYGDIMYKSIRLAQHLQEKGLANEDIMTICAYNSFYHCLVYLASLYLGIRFSAIEPAQIPDECVHLLNIRVKLETEIVVFGNLSFSKLLTITGTENKFEAKPVKDLTDVALIFFSSGTTGLPKAVCATHYGLMFPIICITFSPLSWISGAALFNFCINIGSPRIIVTTFSPETFLKCVERYKVSFVFLAPYQINSLLTYPEISSYDLSPIKCAILGGSTISKRLIQSFRYLLPNCIVTNSYGLTETHGAASHVEHLQKSLPLMLTKINSIGIPFHGFSYKIVNPETEELLGPNMQGEIRIKGKALVSGYYNDSTATAAAFDKDGFLKKGDIGYYDEDCFFYIVDRIKEMFIYRSQHILPAELETILLDHTDIKDAAVIGIPHEGDGDHPLGAIVIKRGAFVTKEEILNYFNVRVPEHKKLRAGVIFVEALPYTSTGKMRRIELRQKLIKRLNMANNK